MIRTIIAVSVFFFLFAYSGCHDHGVDEVTAPTWSQVNTGFWDPNVKSINVTSVFANGSNLFAGTDSGVYLSTNQGANWTPRNTGMPVGSIWCFAANGSLLFAGGGQGVFSSTNDGSTWTASSNGFPTRSWEIYALSFVGSDLLAGTYGGIFRSTNNGLNWEASNGGLSQLTKVDAFQENGTRLFAGGWVGLIASTDQGRNWAPSDSGLTGSYMSVTSFATIDSDIFAGLYTRGVYISTDNGNFWSPAKNGMTNLGVTSLAVSGTQIFAGTVDGVFVSTDNGSSWTSIGLSEPTGGIWSLAISGPYLFAGTTSLNWNTGDPISGVWRYPLQ